MSYHFNNDWKIAIQNEFKKDYYLALLSFLKKEAENEIIFPPLADIFNAFAQTPLSQTKACIIGHTQYNVLYINHYNLK